MIVRRVLIGAGGNDMNTGVNTLHSMNTIEKQRPMYMALVGIVCDIGTVIGPVIGGAYRYAAIMFNGAILSKTGHYKPWYICRSAVALVSGALVCFDSWLQTSYSVIQSVLDPSQVVNAVTFIVFAQLLGLAISLSIAGAIFVNSSLHGLENVLPTTPVKEIQLAISGASGTFFKTLQPATQEVCLEVIISSLQKVYILVYVAAVICFVTSLLLSNRRMTIEV
ncbi:hypothetical protein BOTCAL_0030g00120 [Botryotinia calthae]|uniref:Major facilitator superfamily (MFS) profile domain-containing protein n=1 Tax=Botryotinia calthae TaxID=38488 RepID=A0A4Y8DDK1_9HELO|nr:hypothetical protein BOTCAL_0030g00120 [Botryotinia calthae]